jgi:hypothetical protein
VARDSTGIANAVAGAAGATATGPAGAIALTERIRSVTRFSACHGENARDYEKPKEFFTAQGGNSTTEWIAIIQTAHVARGLDIAP